MAKRKRGGPSRQAEAPSEYTDRKSSKLAVNNYNDLPDSEDEFLSHRDEILLDSGPDAKRRKQIQQDFEELSDEEVLGYSDSQDDDQEEDEDAANYDGNEDDSAASGGPSDVDEDGEVGGWGPNRSDYYNTDKIETEQDALDEEAEARRIQQKQRRALTEADFAFDEDEWAETGQHEDDGKARRAGGVVAEVLPQLHVTPDMTNEDKTRLLGTRYPEFEPLAAEFERLGPVYEELAARVKQMQTTAPTGQSSESPVLVMQYRALSGYMGALAMYFAVLTSTAHETGLPMPAQELREHEVISSLEQYQRLWSAVETLEEEEEELSSAELEGIGESDTAEELSDDKSTASLSDAQVPIKSPAQTASEARRAARLAKTEARLASLDHLTTKTKTKKSERPTKSVPQHDLDSDLGDEDTMDPLEAAAKAAKRKSLRFYTSQIAQKANKRASAGRAAGGDDDVPQRERLRDRAERLNREAEKRGLGKKGHAGDDLDVDGEDDGQDMTNLQREDADGDDADIGEVALLKRMQARKASKTAKEAAYAQAKAEGGRVVPRAMPAVNGDGRREIGYAIEKNKGLTPKRKKDVKNPRVKKRKKFEEKSKKLRSMKPTYKGGESKGGYGGELTGIKRNLVRSTKL